MSAPLRRSAEDLPDPDTEKLWFELEALLWAKLGWFWRVGWNEHARRAQIEIKSARSGGVERVG